MSNRLATSTGPFFVGYEYDKTKDEGQETVQVWQGSETEVRSKANLLEAQGANRIRISAGPGGDWQVRASFPEDPDNLETDMVDTMELDTNAVMRSVYQSPVFRSHFTDYNSTTNHSTRANRALGIIKDCANKYTRGLTEQEINTAKSRYGFTVTGVDVVDAETAIEAEMIYRLDRTNPVLTNDEKLAAGYLFVNIAYRGVTSFIEYQQVFRRTVTAGTPLAVRANYEGAGKIWTTAEVKAWENIPNDGWFQLPDGVQWHKDKPSVLKAYGQKTQLTYHYTEIKTATAMLYQAYNAATLIDVV